MHEHRANLDRVLERLCDNGLRLKKSKCHCMQSSVEYLGHVLDANASRESLQRPGHQTTLQNGTYS